MSCQQDGEALLKNKHGVGWSQETAAEETSTETTMTLT